MIIHKVLNNNAAVVLDENSREKIVMGRGICFQRRAGENLDPNRIDKFFSLSQPDANSKFQALVREIPMEHIAVGEAIITEAKTRLGKKLNDMVYISLIDHVHTSILRFREGITVKNVLLWDIRRFYREEFGIGQWALKLVKETCSVELPEDEAGFIALHLANAQMEQETMHNMYEITRIMQEIANLVKYYFHMEFDEDDVHYYRFVTHLKFFAQRLVERRTYGDEDNEDLWNLIQAKYPRACGCAQKIRQFIAKQYQYELSREEQMYLTIHIERIVNKTGG